MSLVLDLPSTSLEIHAPFAMRLQQALDDMRRGHPVLLVDDFGRENETDLIVAAERITTAVMAMLIRECSGIVCLCLDETTANLLELPLMVTHNESRYGTAFTVSISIEARHGVSTGVSAQDRVTTIRAAIAKDARPSDLVHPGHVFPLRAQHNGVWARRGHTEGAVDLAVLAGLQPKAVLCELTNPDGSMSKGEQILSFARQHKMTLVSIDELAVYRKSMKE
jgi:3,4-dihydroxy 2-butanone 4-phosphate synthase